jgi:hypothetical protein
MLKALVVYYELAVKSVEEGGLTWNKTRELTNDVWFRLTQVDFLPFPSNLSRH